MIFIFFSIILSNFTDSSLQPLNERIEIRGCESDRSQHAIACADNPAKCVICGDSSGCNNQPATSKPTLSCVKCSDKERCPWGYNATATIPCTSDVVFPQKESCYTVANGDTVTRGCTMDAGSECTDDGSCSKCTESGCNRENVAHSSCFQCRSYLEPHVMVERTQYRAFTRRPASILLIHQRTEAVTQNFTKVSSI